MTFDELVRDAPALHSDEEGRLISYALGVDVLEFIDQQVSNVSNTLEIGCGLSTVLFALKGANHTSVVPYPEEVERLQRYCAGHGISTHRTNFILNTSERALPKLDLKNLDFVLIDGRHGFPAPFIDWFYVAPFLRRGGTLVIDDVHLWTCRVLIDFLEAEPEWESCRSFARSVAFTKRGEGSETKEWNRQHFVIQRTSAMASDRE